MSEVDKTTIRILLEDLEEQKDKIGGIIASECPLLNVSVYSKYDRYDDYYHTYYSYSENNELDDYKIVKTERMAVKLFKMEMKARRNNYKKTSV